MSTMRSRLTSTHAWPAWEPTPSTWSPNFAWRVSIGSMFPRFPGLLRALLERFAFDLLLDLHDGVDDAFGPGRASGNVHVDRDEPVDSLDHGVVIENASAGRAGTHGDAPLRLRHLLPDLQEHGHHLEGDPPRNDHQVGLSGREADDFGAEPGEIVPRGQGPHQLDVAAGRSERHGPQGVLAAPVDELTQLGGEHAVGQHGL